MFRSVKLILIVMLGLLLIGAAQALAVPSYWQNAAPLAIARDFHTMTLLTNGKVLVTGGFNGTTTFSSAELYDPATNSWTPAASMGQSRYAHTATLLPNGKVLVTGGYNSATSSYLNSTELYDPVGNSWIPANSMGVTRHEHTATLLSSGKVLVAGGKNSGYLASAELYDPSTGNWTATGDMNGSKYLHRATLLANGKVLVTGGYNGSTLAVVEIYDPAAGTWSGGTTMTTARFEHSAILLSSGKVLVAGGFSGSGALATAELYDPTTNNWSSTGALSTARFQMSALLLPDGRVLAAGGYNGSAAQGSSELYNHVSGIWSATSSMNTARFYQKNVLLQDGKVLVAGGYNGSSYLTSAELYFDLPVIGLKQGTTAVASGGSYDFGSLAATSVADTVFTIENSGASSLSLNTPVSVTGANADQFNIQVQPISPVAASGSTTFTVRFSPTSTGVKNAAVSIANNDPSRNPFTLNLTGTAFAPVTTSIVTDWNTPQKLFSSVDGKGVYVSTDNGATWYPAGNPGNLRIKQLAIHPTETNAPYSNTIFAATFGGGVYKSIDSGDTWTACSNSPSNSLSLAVISTGVFVGHEGGISSSSSNCSIWSDISNGLPNNPATPPVTIAIDPVTSSTLYAGLDGGGIYRKTASTSWTAVAGLPDESKVKAIVLKDSSHLYAAVYDAGVYKSSDSGANWSTCGTAGLTNLDLLSLEIDGNGYLYAGTEEGIFTSSNGCDSWTAMNNSLPN